MNGYKAFYKTNTTEVYANTSYEAQKKAALFFKTKKEHEVTVMLCEKDVIDGVGTQVVHSTSSIG